ncbi:MAG: class sortase [Frankiales bacterium]|nr:class sortase [Frankiales bacterium]
MTENSGDDQATIPSTTGGVGTVPPPPPAAVDPGGGSSGGRRRGFGDVVRTFVRGIGQTLITAGLVLLLFVVYEVWVSNLFAHQKQSQVHQQLAQSWQQGQDPLHGEDRLNLPSGKQVVIPAGEGFANLYIPRFGKDFAWTIVQGTDDAALERGPGHYTDTAVPGQLGNFAVAGHRVGKGEPFLNLDQLVPGDAVVVQTAGNWYVYRVLGDQAAYAAALKQPDKDKRNKAIEAALAAPDKQGVVGREIVDPSDIGVIDPVPNHPNTAASRALLTLTTCHPKYTANQRMIIHASLARAVAVRGSAIPKELPGGTL